MIKPSILRNFPLSSEWWKDVAVSFFYIGLVAPTKIDRKNKSFALKLVRSTPCFVEQNRIIDKNILDILKLLQQEFTKKELKAKVVTFCLFYNDFCSNNIKEFENELSRILLTAPKTVISSWIFFSNSTEEVFSTSSTQLKLYLSDKFSVSVKNKVAEILTIRFTPLKIKFKYDYPNNFIFIDNKSALLEELGIHYSNLK